MSEDARFSDADGRALRLRALDPDDLRVISALVQDAVLVAADMAWMKRHRRLAVLLNRFRWENGTRTPERVRSMLVVEGVTGVRSQGFDHTDGDLVLSLLALGWEAAEGGEDAEAGPGDRPGRVVLTLAGDGAVAAEAEALEVTLTDVTRPYAAPSGRAPSHPG